MTDSGNRQIQYQVVQSSGKSESALKWLIIGGGLFLGVVITVVVGIFFFVKSLTHDAEVRVRQFLDGTARGEYQQVYDEYFSPALKNVQSYEEFAKLAKQYAYLFKIRRIKYTSRRYDSGHVILKGRADLMNGYTASVEFILIKHNDRWTLIRYSITADT